MSTTKAHPALTKQTQAFLLLKQLTPMCLKGMFQIRTCLGNPLSRFLSASQCLSLSPFVMQRALFSFAVTSRWTIILCLGPAQGLFIELTAWCTGGGEWAEIQNGVVWQFWATVDEPMALTQLPGCPQTNQSKITFYLHKSEIPHHAWLMALSSQMVVTAISITYERGSVFPLGVA